MTIALYQRIAQDLLARLSAGEHPVGSQLPIEQDLMTHYEASRNTVRSALQQLQAMGLISRRKNRGTTVEMLPESAAFTQSLSSLEGLTTLASEARRTIVSAEDVVLDVQTAKQLGCPAGSRWHCLAMLRRPPGRSKPLGWTEAFIDPHYAGVRQAAESAPDKLLADLIETLYGRRIDTVEQIATACAIGALAAPHLQVDAGTPGMRVVRQYRDAARGMVVVTRSIYPEGRYSLTTTLLRSR